MKEYLLETFRFNDYANRLVLSKIGQVPDKSDCIRYFSHMVNSMNKWLKRIQVYPSDPQLDWWLPVYPLEQLEGEWDKSFQAWIDFLESKEEKDLFEEQKFVGFDGGHWAALLKDIAVQLNYHSIHHRAQIQTLIRNQGLEPDFVDYIGTRYRKVAT